jgi:branched-chain amino acid aminotransferase/4-amino-4-deoxychorismate lyase
MKSMYLFFNNTLQTEENFKITLSNRAFNYGDGLFETMIIHKSQLLHLHDHYERVTAGMKALSIEIPEYFKPETILEQAHVLVKENNINELGRIKILIYRKSGGLYTPGSSEAETLITVTPGRFSQEVKPKTFFFDEIKLHPSSISRFKTCNALPYILAAIEGKKRMADDMILSDTEGHIAECISSSIFWIRNDVFYTPSLETGCIDGIKRKQIIQFLREHRINCKEGKFSKQELLQAELVFTCNVTGLSVINEIHQQKFNASNALYEKLKNHFKN